MVKPVQFYALVRGPYRHGFEVLGVTSVTRGQIYGRTVPFDLPTHVAARDLLHEFPPGTTKEFAAGARDRAQKAHDLQAPAIREARERVNNLEAHQRRSVLEAAKGPDPQRKLELGPPPPAPDWSCSKGLGRCDCLTGTNGHIRREECLNYVGPR